MAVKLHRCAWLWNKIGGHPCWRVQKALDEKGVQYEVVPGSVLRWKRDPIVALSGQKSYPVIEFEDGTIYREASKHMAETIRADKLDEKRGRAVRPTG